MDIKKRLKEKDNSLVISKTALSYLTKKGYNPQYGARPLKRLIQNEILTPIATQMISNGMMQGGSVSINVKDDKLTFIVKKKAVSSTKRKQVKRKTIKAKSGKKVLA